MKMEKEKKDNPREFVVRVVNKTIFLECWFDDMGKTGEVKPFRAPKEKIIGQKRRILPERGEKSRSFPFKIAG